MENELVKIGDGLFPIDDDLLKKLGPDYWRGKRCLAAGYPWLTFGAIERLGSILKKHMSVLEFGIGGSTVFFLERCAHVCSVDGSRKWIERVVQRVNCHPNCFFMNSSGLSLGTILHIAGLVDLILIDSNPKPYHRMLILRDSIEYLKPGGYLVLDNYARRPYKSATKMLFPWPSETFDDPHWSGCGTKIWRKPE